MEGPLSDDDETTNAIQQLIRKALIELGFHVPLSGWWNGGGALYVSKNGKRCVIRVGVDKPE